MQRSDPKIQVPWPKLKYDVSFCQFTRCQAQFWCGQWYLKSHFKKPILEKKSVKKYIFLQNWNDLMNLVEKGWNWAWHRVNLQKDTSYFNFGQGAWILGSDLCIYKLQTPLQTRSWRNMGFSASSACRRDPAVASKCFQIVTARMMPNPPKKRATLGFDRLRAK